MFGAVSIGTDWRFLRLDGDEAEIDEVVYSIHNIRKLFGILTLIALGPS